MREIFLTSLEIGELVSLEDSLDSRRLEELASLLLPWKYSHPLIIYESPETEERFCCNGHHHGVIYIHQNKTNSAYLIEKDEDIPEFIGDICLGKGIRNLDELEERVQKKSRFKSYLFSLYNRYLPILERFSRSGHNL